MLYGCGCCTSANGNVKHKRVVRAKSKIQMLILNVNVHFQRLVDIRTFLMDFRQANRHMKLAHRPTILSTVSTVK